MKIIADDPIVRAKFYLEVPAGTACKDIQKKVIQQDSLVTVTMYEGDLTVAVLDKLAEHSTLSKLHVKPGGQGLHLDMCHHPLYAKLYALMYLGLVEETGRRLRDSQLGTEEQ